MEPEVDNETSVRPARASTASVTRKSKEDGSSDDGRSSVISGRSYPTEETTSSVDSGLKKVSSAAGKAMRSFFNPTYQSRADQFRKLFKDVPAEDPFVIDYSCAYQREILVHGRLYVTRERVCFHANIFKWETCFVLRFCDIAIVSKERTAMVIPNAIQLTTNTGEKHFFASFPRRDRAFTLLYKLWLANTQDRVPINVTEIWNWVDHSYDMADVQQANSVDDDADDEDKSDTLKRQDLPPDYADHDEQLTSMHRSATCPSIDNSSESSEDVAVCQCTHDGTQLLSHTYDFSVDHLFNMLFTDSNFLKKFNKRRKITDAVPGEWSNAQRTYIYTMALSAAVGPKCAYCTEKQILLVDNDGVKVIACEIINGRVPYGDSFIVHTRYCITRLGPGRCRLVVHGRVQFIKNVWTLVKSFIEKPTMAGLDEYFSALHNEMCRSPSIISLGDDIVPAAVDDADIILDGNTNSLTRSAVLDYEPLPVATVRASFLPPHREWIAYILLFFMACMLMLNTALLYGVYSVTTSNGQNGGDSMTRLEIIQNQVQQLTLQVQSLKLEMSERGKQEL